MAETGYTENLPEIVCASNMDFSSDEEGYASPYSCWSDEDNAHSSNRQLMDELPVFSTQSLSPSGRSLSPIDVDFSSPPRSSRGNSAYNTPFDSPSQMIPIGKDFVSLEEIQARIGLTPPADQDPERCRSPRLNLETIFEDEFLETPPKNRKDPRTNRDMLRRSFRNRPPVLGALATTVVEAECSVSAIESLGQQFGNKFKVGLD
ncbi:uncharacterized protein LOC135717322 [Ochlerotatus camptorhynchus]|uniref:uncharacterized protein LOC135717322 n=1 Tax=Ochlerotatus camptorhynchus TaxID=644619 RepID=UPI0031D0FB18